MIATSDLKLTRGAANYLDILNLIGRNARKLAVAFIFLTRYAASVDQYLVASQPQAAAQWIEADGSGGVTETRLDAVYLGQ